MNSAKLSFPRFTSIDYFRGLAVALMLVYDFIPSFSRSVPLIFQHGRNDMLLFGDFVAPFFLFIMGVSLAITIFKRRTSGVKETTIFLQVLRRAILLLLIGVLLDDLRSPLVGGTFGLGGTYYIRWGVLETLGASYLISYLMMLTKPSVRFTLIGGLIAGYLAILSVPSLSFFVRTHSHGSPLSSISWALIAVFGMLAGERLMRSSRDFEQYLYWLGGILIIAGTALSFITPARKELVSSSYVLITGGGSAFALMLIYYVIETRRSVWFNRLMRPLREFGSAALLTWILQYALAGYFIWYFRMNEKLPDILGITFAVAVIALLWLVVTSANRRGIRVPV